jgi:glycosyltransferase involved in cell wall biosynthesis
VRPVTVIIPTLARRERGPGLRRALDSVLAQRDVRPLPLLVINGEFRDPDLVAELAADRRLRVVTRDEASLPGALRRGRELVDTPWFAELDDDDLLLPGALEVRLRALEEMPGTDVVVTNGFRRGPDGDRLHVPAGSTIHEDPLGALLIRNWLLPGSWICRTEALGVEVFDAMPRFLECTYLAVRFAITGRMRFLEQPTVVWCTETPGADSKSRDFRLGQVAALRHMERLPLSLPPSFRAGLSRKVSAECHDAARMLLEEGRLAQAVSWHLRSLGTRRGWRYLPFTGRLIAALGRRQ